MNPATQPCTLGQLADQIRSKNAGPFWITFDIFFSTSERFERAVAAGVITPDTVSNLYGVPVEHIKVFTLPDLRVVKISFPRNVVAGSFEDSDLHAGQQHVPLAQLAL